MKCYDDMLYMPHHTSTTRPRMSPTARAAQFSSFAALAGFEEACREEERLTDARHSPTEDELEALNQAKTYLLAHIARQPAVRITCFIPDPKKDGGRYVTLAGQVRRLDEVMRKLWFTDGREVALDSIVHYSFDDPVDSL